MHVLNEDGKTLDEIYNNLSTKLKKDDIDKILNNMIDLKILRLKNEEIIENDYKNEALHLPGITLMICQDCNMRCSYCFAGMENIVIKVIWILILQRSQLIF